MNNLPTISDYQTAIGAAQCLKAPILQGGKVVVHKGAPMLYAGGFCVVFPFITQAQQKVAVRCWTASIGNAEYRTREIARTLGSLALPYFIAFDFIPDAILTGNGLHPVVYMQWVEAITLKAFIGRNIQDSAALLAAANKFLELVKTLHQHQLAHGDLQHDNILVKQDGTLVLVDYDSMYVPALQGEPDEIKGLKGYQHPKRQENKLLTFKADYFSELVIYLSLLTLAERPDLWHALNLGKTEALLFSEQDLLSPASSRIFSILESCSDTVSKLAEALRLACSENDISALRPLEDILSDITRMPWDGKEQVRHAPPPAPVFDTDLITNKFSSNKGPVPLPDLDVSSITNKF